MIISSDGKTITCNRDDVDVSEAFMTETAEGLMQEKTSDTLFQLNNRIGDVSHKFVGRHMEESSNPVRHLPHFIALDTNFKNLKKGSDIDKKLYELRKTVRDADPENAKLLEEREKTPEDVRWQITPLIEARIYRCNRL